MLPDVRLLIAATFVSVAALICGFAMFAALRISHEPLARLPSPAAPAQLISEGSAAPMAYAAPEPFDRRFRLDETQPPSEAVASLLRMLDRRLETDQGGQPAVDLAPAPPGDSPAAMTPGAATNTAAEAPPSQPIAPARRASQRD